MYMDGSTEKINYPIKKIFLENAWNNIAPHIKIKPISVMCSKVVLNESIIIFSK